MEKSLKNSKTWKLFSKINPDLKELMLKIMTQEESSYISIYNGTIKKYDVYAMKYYLDDKTLEIHQYGDYNSNNAKYMKFIIKLNLIEMFYKCTKNDQK